MNIIVKPKGDSLYYCRPDTTWERESKDFYSPDCVNEIYCAPVVYARIGKAGKCIGRKYVGRYYSEAGFGMLLYCKVGDSLVSCADHTSLLAPAVDKSILSGEEFRFEVVSGEESVSEICGADLEARLDDAVCSSSELISVRTGDAVVLELDFPKPVAARKEGSRSLKAELNGESLFKINMIF